MIITELASYIRDQAKVTPANLNDTQLYRYMNISYHEIENAIVTNLNENFFWNEITGSLVANQGEYTNDQSISGNLSGTNKVIGVSIDNDGTGIFMPCIETTGENIDEKRRSGHYQYTVMDNSIEIFPTPVKSVTNGLKMRVIQNLVDLSSSTPESSIFNGKIHPNNHFFIALGAFEYVFRQLGKDVDAQNARQVFLSKLYGDGQQDIGLLGRLNNRNITTMYSKAPNTTKFE